MRILILANNDTGLYKFRKELIIKLLERHDVHVSVPFGDYNNEIAALGCKIHELIMDRHSVNLLKEIKLLKEYSKLCSTIKPDIVLTYTVKPNIYGGIICRLKKIPYIANITGLGGAVMHGGLLQSIIVFLYRVSLGKAKKVFFQNAENKKFFEKHKIIRNRCRILPGSGVNLQEHCYEEYPDDKEKIIILTIGRIMKDKGTDEILEAAEIIKKDYPKVVFRFVGGYDGDYQEKIQEAVKNNIIEYIGKQSDVHAVIKNSHATLHASYHEGMANVLLESAACGRPVMATNVPGCKETFDDGISGIVFEAKDAYAIVQAIRKLLEMSNESREEMGKQGRKKVENEFDRNIVINEYIKAINE